MLGLGGEDGGSDEEFEEEQVIDLEDVEHTEL